MSQLIKGSDMDLALRQLIKEYGYTAISQQLFILAMEDRDNWNFGQWFVYGGSILFLVFYILISICVRGVI